MMTINDENEKDKMIEASAFVWMLLAEALLFLSFISFISWANMRLYFLILQNCSLRAKIEVLVLQKEISWKNGRG